MQDYGEFCRRLSPPVFEESPSDIYILMKLGGGGDVRKKEVRGCRKVKKSNG